MGITFDISPEILEKYGEEKIREIFNIVLITIEQRDSIVDDFIPTEEFLDFKKIEWEDIPDEGKKELEAMRRGKIEFVK